MQNPDEIVSDAVTARQFNLTRKPMSCLGCGKSFVTDRCHRFCRVCLRRNRRNEFYDLPRHSVDSMPSHN